MRLSNKIINIIALTLFTAATVLTFSTCKPAIGTPWYPRAAAGSVSRQMFITEITVNENLASPVLAEQPTDEADRLKKFVEAGEYFVNVPPSVEEIVSENIKVKAVNSLSKMEEVAVTVEIHGEGVPLLAGAAIPVTIKIKDTQAQYGEITKIIKITRNEPFDLKLESLTIAGENAMEGSVTLPYNKSMVSAADIRAEFSYGTQKTVIPVVLEKNSIELKEEDSIDVKISVRALKGQYKDFEYVVSVTRAKRAEGEDAALEPIEIYVHGIKSEIGKEIGVPINITQITENDIIVIFKTFDHLPVKLTPNPIKFDSTDIVNAEISVEPKAGKYLGWNMRLTIKKNAGSVYNPVDKNGNKKYIVKVNTITEEVSPFDYYTENFEFPAAKFDEWVLHMPSMSGIIASYRFKEGSWQGNPEQTDNDPFTIGASLKAIDNIKIYRYKTRADRWGGSYTPSSNPHDSRFYFYRFTANASAGIKPDSSMFCVDRYSKFLFYYSDPGYLKNIMGSIIPQNWMDYAAPSSGDHIQFGKPFYMSDPVGYVKEDGSVVMYSWIKDNINASNYHAQENAMFTKPAEKKSNGAGFSPYRNNIITKRTEVVTTENPDYTLATPLILGQPKALRIALNSMEEAVMTVKTAPVPEGENLSYQWYKNGEQSNEDGTPIDGAVSDSYSPDKTLETNCYVYCEVTNTNTKTGVKEKVKSDAVKLLISSGSLYTDAAQPKIFRQPESKTLPINTSGTISLKVEALSTDMGQISYRWYKNTSDNNQNGTELGGEISATLNLTVDTSSPKTEYYYCIVTNTNENVDGKKTASRPSDVAKIEVEESYPLIFKVNDDKAGRIIALKDGKPVELNSYVKKGEQIQFLAFCNSHYETQKWEGAGATGNINLAEITINSADDAQKTVCEMAYIPPGKLTVKASQLKNTGFDYTSAFMYDGYFVHNFRIYSYYDTSKPEEFTTIWEKYNGKKMPLWGNVPVTGNAHYIANDHSESNNAISNVKYEYFKLDTELIHYRGQYSSGSAQYYPIKESILSDYKQSAITFKYNRQTEKWECITPNTCSIPYVTVAYNENFILTKGETKNFVITYSYSGEVSGSAEVTYEITWE